MALKISKPVAQVEVQTKTQTVPEPTVVPAIQSKTEVEAMTEEYIILFQKLEQVGGKKLLSRMEEIRKKLVADANENVADDKPAVFKCETGEVRFSERGESTKIPEPMQLIKNLEQKFGSDVAYSIVNIAITPLKKILSDMELTKYITKEPGSRTLKDVIPVVKES